MTGIPESVRKMAEDRRATLGEQVADAHAAVAHHSLGLEHAKTQLARYEAELQELGSWLDTDGRSVTVYTDVTWI